MRSSRAPRAALAWPAALVLLYLAVPVVAFLIRLPATDWSQAAAPGVWHALWISVYSATIATGVSTVLGVPLAYLLARSRRWYARVLGTMVQLPLALPPLVSGILLIFVVGPYTPVGRFFGGALTSSVVGIVLAQVFVAAPFLIVAARSAFAALDPAADDVAATLGHHALARFARVALPSAAGGIRSGMLLCWLRAFGEFGATVVLAYNPHSLPVFIYVQFSGPGLPGTVIPVLVTLAAALGMVLVADHASRRRRPRSDGGLPSARRPASVAGPVLDFSVRAHLGGFRLDVGNAGTSRNLAVIGPSGSGKTALLRTLAGLLEPEDGHLRADAVDLLGVPPERRGVGYLPQESTLLHRLPVARQITFGVGADPAVAAYWAHRLHLDDLLGRLPSELSGGQRRRVALARALAREPEILLLDEPFTGLDAPVRDELRRTLRVLERETGLCTVLVTHDPEEAALLSDEVMVLSGGSVLQSGGQREVFAHPSDPEVARLVGARNVRSGVVRAGELLDGGLRVPVPGVRDGEVSWCVRPEDVRITTAGSGAGAGPVGLVTDAMHLGAVTELSVALGNTELAVVVPADEAPEIGEPCAPVVPPHAVTVWPGARYPVVVP